MTLCPATEPHEKTAFLSVEEFGQSKLALLNFSRKHVWNQETRHLGGKTRGLETDVDREEAEDGEGVTFG